jgi:carbon monoxide dehydrogenase subunit G
MRLDGQFKVRAQPDEVYAFLTDPRKLGGHLPDVTKVDIQDDDHFTVTASVGVSHIRGTMIVKLTIRDRQPPVSTTIVGSGSGLASVVDLVTRFRLEPAGAVETLVHWHGDVTISGKLAAFGPQGLLERLARRNIDSFIEGVRRGLEAQAAGRDS